MSADNQTPTYSKALQTVLEDQAALDAMRADVTDSEDAAYLDQEQQRISTERANLGRTTVRLVGQADGTIAPTEMVQAEAQPATN